ncbi:MAG: NADH-quinone oxidoreductase subunit C [candidate division NC10 bacterium]
MAEAAKGAHKAEAAPPRMAEAEGTPEAKAFLEALRAKVGDAILEARTRGREVVMQVRPDRNVEVAQALYEMGLEYLNCLCGVDWIAQNRLEVVYNVSSLSHPVKVEMKVFLPRDDPRVRTVVPIWASANWHERETYDLFGVVFEEHPDLRRILLPEDWMGYPLRKDYEDERMPRFDAAEKKRRARLFSRDAEAPAEGEEK